jgi:hypothetical protein
MAWNDDVPQYRRAAFSIIAVGKWQCDILWDVLCLFRRDSTFDNDHKQEKVEFHGSNSLGKAVVQSEISQCNYY